ncbi:MAG: GYF domain-containing protein [Luteolibacter sp.]|jgi:hypothetical protein
MQWYYSKDSAQHGPVPLQDLQAKIRSGEIAPDALIWREGMADWTSANAIPEIGVSLAPALPVSAAATVYAPPASPGSAGFPPIANARPSSGLAIASLILGILGLTSCTFITGIPAVICGHMAMGRTHPKTGNLGGRGMAIAGLVMGYICSAILVIFAIYFVAIIGAAASSSNF